MVESMIVMSKQANKLDNSVKQKAYSFLEKLGANDETPGLHIEPILRAVDPRVRTGRVDKQYRAVLFRLDNDGQRYYVVHGFYNHDDAINIAMRTRLSLNPINGMPSFDMVEPEGPLGGVPEAVAGWGAPAAPGAPVVAEAPAPVAAPVTPESPVVGAVAQHPVLSVSADELVNGLGFSEELAVRAVAVSDEDALMGLAAEVEGWRGAALLDLYTGRTIDQIREELELTQRDDVEDTDEAIIDSFQAHAAQMEFAVIEGADALRAVIDGGDFGAWRVFLHPTQRKWVEGRWKGPARVTGGAGTGKTVVVLHRANSLLREHPGARLVATTFTRNLADELSRNLRLLNPELALAAEPGQPGAYVSGIDALATAVLRGAGEGLGQATAAVLGAGRADVSRRTDERAAWTTALEDADDDLAAHLRNQAFLSSEYEQVILPGFIATEADYLRARREGRGVRLNRAARKAVWKVVERYRAVTRLAGTISHAEAAAVAAALLEQTGPLADHVLVDEGQDLSACHWRLVRALVADGPDDIFIAEDSHQRIYGARLVLSRYGINTRGRSRRLTLNYRTTAQILHWATGVLEGGEYVDLDEGKDSVEGYRSARSGPLVRVIEADSMTDELDKAAETLRAWLDAGDREPETLAVLVRARAMRDLVVAGLAERGVPVSAIDQGGVRRGRPVVMTMHRAKGTEFSRVLLFNISHGSIPAPLRAYDYDEAEHDDAMLRERSLLYVAASRARDELVVTWNGEASELLGK